MKLSHITHPPVPPPSPPIPSYLNLKRKLRNKIIYVVMNSVTRVKCAWLNILSLYAILFSIESVCVFHSFNTKCLYKVYQFTQSLKILQTFQTA